MLKLWHIDPAQFPKRGYAKHDLKFAFVVGKKVQKSAVKRNFLKRRMREAVRLLLKNENMRPGSLIVVMAKPEMVGKGYGEIAESVEKTLRKAKVLK